MGHGFDSSDDDDGGGGGGWASMADYEARATAATRAALLANEEELWRNEDEVNAKDDQKDKNEEEEEEVGGFGWGGGRSRYVAGDPFAAEKPDVDSWRKHITYLCVKGVRMQGNQSASIGQLALGKQGSGAENMAAGASEGGEGVVWIPHKVTAESASRERAAMAADHDGKEEAMDVAHDTVSRAAESYFLSIQGVSAVYADKDIGTGGEEVFACHGEYEECLAYHRDVDDDDEGDNKSKRSSSGPSKQPADMPLICGAEAVREEVVDLLLEELWRQLVPEFELALGDVLADMNTSEG